MKFQTTQHFIDGRNFIVPAGDNASVHYFTGTDRENIYTALSHVPDNRKALAIQAGGNLGFFPWKFSSRFDVVLTFEPEPLNFYCLSHNVQEDNVVKIQACLGSEHKWVNIRNPDNSHVGLCEVDRDNTANGNIPTLTIDSLMVPACDLIQLDLEGYEYFALLGAEDTIKKYRPVIVLEMTGHETKYGVEAGLIDKTLANWGYRRVAQCYLDVVYKHDDT